VLKQVNLTAGNFVGKHVKHYYEDLDASQVYYLAIYTKANATNTSNWHNMVAVKNWKMTIFHKETTEEIYVSENTFTYKPKYRYGFNGMERGDEMKGIGNSYDFGARLYDPRLGRWFSPDPMKNLLPGISAYSFGYNCPIVVIDPDGKNGKVTINYSDNSIVLESTIYIYGPGANETVADQLNQAMAEGTGKYEVTDAEDETKTWTVTVKVNYVYSESVEASANAHDLTTEDAIGSSTLDNSTFGIDPEDNVLYLGSNVGSPVLGGKTGMGKNIGWANNIGSALHEPWHFLGFDERYLKYSSGEYQPKELEGDFVSNGVKLELLPFHYTDIADFAIKLSEGTSGTYYYDSNTGAHLTGTSTTANTDTNSPYTSTKYSKKVSSGGFMDNTGSGKNPLNGVSEGNSRAKKVDQ